MNMIEIGRLLAGGAAIGAAVALLMLVNGRVAGISGIYRQLLTGRFGQLGWRLAFVLGLCLPGLWLLLHQRALPVAGGMPLLLISGLLVGAGTQLAAGCTSGHGVCGMANLSQRSLVATLTFMGTAMLVRFVAGAL